MFPCGLEHSRHRADQVNSHFVFLKVNLCCFSRGRKLAAGGGKKAEQNTGRERQKCLMDGGGDICR